LGRTIGHQQTHHGRYPLEKVIAYKNLVRPWVLNNLETQLSLRDRRNVYVTLREHNIPVAPHIIVRGWVNSCARVLLPI
jgi:hypothetical protein